MLPKPNCLLGYTRAQIEAILGDRLAIFAKWMVGSTSALCQGEPEAKFRNYVDTHPEFYGLGPHVWCHEAHGAITYVDDLARFLRGDRINDD